MSLVEHLTELRKRLVWISVVFVITLIAGLVIADPIIHFLKAESPAKDLEWNVFSPWDAIGIYMKVAFVFSFVVTLPVILFQLWRFVSPGLRKEEQRVSLMYIPFAVILFLIGLAFGYFVLFPMAMYFTGMMTERLELTQTYGVTQYFTFMFNILLPISFFFELPLVVMFLTKLRLLNPIRLRKMRKYAYFTLLVASAFITPPDLLSAIIVFIPLTILYEFSIWLSSRIFRKQLEADAKFEEEYA